MSRQRRRRLAANGAIALLLFAALFALDLAYGVGFADDSWSLLVFHRVGSGEVLYRDVFFGATPLSVWIGAGATKLLGTEVVVLKGLVALCSAAAALLSARIAGQLDVGRPGRVVVAAASIAYLDLPSPNLYTPLAYLLLLVSMSAVLAWRRRWERESPPGDEVGLLIIAGAAAGLCAATKQNVGLLTIAAVVLSVGFLSPVRAVSLRSRFVEPAVVVGAAGLGAAIPLIPVATAGALGDLGTFGFHKGSYVEHGAIPYLDGVRTLVDLARRPFWHPGALAEYTAFLLPPLCLLALLATAWHDGARRAGTVALFVAVAVAGVFPRVNFAHVNDAVPACAIALAWSMKELTPDASQAAKRTGFVAAAVVVALAALSLVRPALRTGLGDGTRSDIPHFSGPLVPVGFSNRAIALGRSLRSADGGSNRTFLLMPSAAAFYLVSGLSDPTQYDYPIVNTFGSSGQQGVIDAIRRGAVRRVCLGSFGTRPPEPQPQPRATGFRGFQPRVLMRYARTRMEQVRRLGSTDDVAPLDHCTLYRIRD
jgi:hypothetical protein